MAGDAILTRADIVWGLERIREGLADGGVRGTLKIIGGCAMILGGHADRDATVDIDAVVLIPHDMITRISTEVARERGWPPNWLNLEAQGLYPAYAGHPLWNVDADLSDEALTVELATKEALLAMKLNASRAGRDDADIRALMSACGVETVAQADDHFSEFFRGESLPDKAVFLLRALGYSDGDSSLYRSVPDEDPVSVRLRRPR